MSDTKAGDQDSPYIPCDHDDPDYFGAKDVVEDELRYVHARRGTSGGRPADLAGLALSGGGIRSASFALGIMQAMAYKGWLEKIDYLSTVSGGGYIGTSLTWVLENDQRFGVDRDSFPFAAAPMSGQAPTEADRQPLAERLKTAGGQIRGRLLRFLRQNAKYLTPGKGFNLFSLAAVAVRGGLVGLLVYGGLMTLVLYVVLRWGGFTALRDVPLVPALFEQNSVLALSFAGLLAFGASMLLYAIGTLLLSIGFPRLSYPLRRCFERGTGYLLPVLIGLFLLGSVPYAYDFIKRQGRPAAVATERFEISGQRTGPGAVSFSGTIAAESADAGGGAAGSATRGATEECDGTIALTVEQLLRRIGAEMRALTTGIIAILLGFFAAIGAFIKTNKIQAGRLPLGLFVAVGVAMLLFGMVLFTYAVARVLACAPMPVLLSCGATLACLIAANVNELSVHRFYRDRLMETFMPNVRNVVDKQYDRAHENNRANILPLHIACSRPRGVTAKARPGPYHIINANVVLVSSPNAKYRGRGGDNFILSPAYCGSNATGWRSSADFMSGSLTLASAMAISGAAVNPSAGCGGEGVTRSPFLSILMGILNLRLGYWAANPRKTGRRCWPNFIQPGLYEVVYRRGLNEHAPFLQLSDGGHFENLGLYELIRRKLPLIIVCDGSADPKFSFGDLANAIEKVRVDFGTLVQIEKGGLERLVPRKGADADVAAASQAHLLATIRYADNSVGRLLYLTPTFFKGLSADLYGFKKEHPAFPDEPTSDQFFDERQFEAYRELGFQAAWNMMLDGHVAHDDIVIKVMGKPQATVPAA